MKWSQGTIRKVCCAVPLRPELIVAVRDRKESAKSGIEDGHGIKKLRGREALYLLAVILRRRSRGGAMIVERRILKGTGDAIKKMKQGVTSA